MRYRIALCGFSEFEYRAMHFSFQHPPNGFGESEFDVVDALSEADFAVVDADSSPAVKGVVMSGRVGQSVFVGHMAPDGAALHLPRPIDTHRILRSLGELIIRLRRPARSRSQAPDNRELPTLDDVVAQPQAAIEAAAYAPPVPDPLGSLPRVQAKAAARAAARRARLANHPFESADAEPLRDVLVLDADAVAAARLRELLERFGFSTHAVTQIDAAEAQLAARPFAAVFVDVALDDEGVALLQHIRALPAPWPHASPALLMVSAPLDPMDAVRAALAGVPKPLTKPVTRGDVARALESHGVALPSDARQR